MSRSGAVDLTWGDGEHRFRLPIKQLEELETKCGAGTFEIYGRLSPKTDMFGAVTAAPAWKVMDLYHTIRLGLIGGGMAPHEAVALVQAYIEVWPLTDTAIVCAGILGEALSGHEDEPAGKDEAVEASPASTSAASTKPGAPRAPRRKKSGG